MSHPAIEISWLHVNGSPRVAKAATCADLKRARFDLKAALRGFL